MPERVAEDPSGQSNADPVLETPLMTSKLRGAATDDPPAGFENRLPLDTHGQNHLWSAKGSEDLLLQAPDSDAGSEAGSEAGDDERINESPLIAVDANHNFRDAYVPVAKLDLKRFAFAGAV